MSAAGPSTGCDVWSSSPSPVDPGEISFGGDGRLRGRARLLFRCGSADEGLPRLGLTVLAVRIALDGLSSTGSDLEGPPAGGGFVETAVRVGASTTAVEFTGSPDAVTAGRLRFTQRLGTVDEAVFEAIRTRLLAEEQRGLLPVMQLPGAVALFGVAGYGATDFSLLGLASTTYPGGAAGLGSDLAGR